ncbi:MAG: HesA/MoeB/ThiF family protein [Acidobacteria bacterium]|nr:HesA/MoeB/ThiF family protein [Acidobacteriota bacterium]
MDLTKEELLRYSRQITIPGFGLQGQLKLKNAGVFIAGAGGLGSISSYYLAAAGVGRLRIVDRDTVDYSNLNRQIIHWTGDIGSYKTDSAIRKLREFNPDCAIEAVREEINEDTCESLVADCSIIVDAMDNMPARRILNAVSVKKSIPYIYGGVHQLDGMVSTFLPGKTPCLECIFPDTGFAPSATPPSILGPVPGVVASIQSIEAIKILLDFETPLAGRLLCFCGTDMTFREFKIKRDPECPVCGKSKTED